MSQIEAARDVVRRRLEQWGLEFALDRETAGLGYGSTNILHKMMKQGVITRGSLPGVAADAHEIELIVTGIARQDMRVACCMRGYFCGSMRRKVERFQKANELAERHRIRRFSLSTYLNEVAVGQNLVLVYLVRRSEVA